MPHKTYQGPLQDIFDEQGGLKHQTMVQINEQSLSAMRIIDLNFTIVAQNPAMDRVVKQPMSMAVGKKCYEVARARQFCHTEQCPHALVMSGQARVEQSYLCELWDGSTFPAWVMAAPFYDEQHQLAGSLQSVRDETHLVSINQAVEQKKVELERLLRLADGQNKIIKALNRETRIEDLASNVLRLMPRYTPVVTGVIYLFSERDDRLVPLATLALSGPAPEFSLGQGLPGEVALREEAIFVSNLPQTFLAFRTGTGAAEPPHIACLPIQVGNQFLGVMELAAFQPLTEERPFLEDVALQLGIAMQNAIRRKQTEDLAIEVQANNTALEAQNDELRAQSEELIAQSEEIQSQAEELIAQRDALERKTLEADEANRMKSIFLSNMSHELRTPLNAILGLTRLMGDGVAGQVSEQQAQYLEVITRNGGNLLDLINDILDLARIETGREEVQFDQIHLRGFLESVTFNIKSLAERQGLAFVLQITPEVSTMVSDERKLGQILTNLLGNSIKFTTKGTITLSALLRDKEGRGAIHFIVQDTGIGIPADHLELIFEPFFQVDGSTGRKYKGSGLGLNICKKLVELLGGEIKVVSEPGRGSSFTVILPIDRRGKNRLPDQAWQEKLRLMFQGRPVPPEQQMTFPALTEQKPSPPPVSWQARPGGGIHILLVDDDMISVRELGVYLREVGYRISFTLDGSTGLQMLEKDRPDLILLDLVMPIMDGFTFLLEMNGKPQLAGIPVLVLTAMDLDVEQTRRLPANVKGVLLKGNIREAHLLEKIKAVVGLPLPVREEVGASGQEVGDLSPPPLAKGRPRPGGRRILVAEDKPDNLFLIEEILKSGNFEMLRAGNGQEAIEMAGRLTPDLILMDIQMPDISGLEAIKQIRQSPALQHIPIVALTARAMKGDREEFMATGCDDYIAKPVDPAKLLAVLHTWLGKEQ
jgi:signal transduction histidine kinase/CheY-like chemotaxis protein